MKTIDISVRYGLPDTLIADRPPAGDRRLVATSALGLTHVLIDFRRDDLARMLELLELVTATIRPAVEKA